MKKTLLLCLLLWVSGVKAQDAHFPIFTYGADTVYNDEFMRVFNKNKRDDVPPTKEEIMEYLDLYVKFKLKVSEAYQRQMDTVPTFQNELAGYRKQLSGPYLTDKEVNERLIKEAYDRLQEEVNASHLLIRCDKDGDASGCQQALEQILQIQQQILNGELTFEEAASRYSQDPSAAVNKGNLGYFTAFQMIYPFENAAFNGEVGSVSEPILTRFGYHLVQVHDRRPALGDIMVGHIMIKYYNDKDVDSAQRRAQAVYEQLLSGADWSSMVNTFSEDHSSVPNDGKINLFNRTTPNIPEEFKNAAYELKEDGAYSPPIKTRYGWHIIKRFELMEPASLDEMRESIRRKVERDSRSDLNREVVLDRIKKENGFSLHGKASSLYGHFDSSLLIGRWQYKPAMKKQSFGSRIKALFVKPKAEQALMSIGEEDYMVEEFLLWAEFNQVAGGRSIEWTVDRLLSTYVDEMNMSYEEAHLETKYPEFAHIMQEYKDGILLFELTDEQVWSRAIQDSTGLADFYERNKDSYMWPERAEVVIYSFKAEVNEVGARLARAGLDQEIVEQLNGQDPLAATVRPTYLENGDELLAGLPWSPGFHALPDLDGRKRYLSIRKLVPPQPKPLKSNLGQVTSDFQDELEAKWIATLRKAYPVHIFENNVRLLYAE